MSVEVCITVIEDDTWGGKIHGSRPWYLPVWERIIWVGGVADRWVSRALEKTDYLFGLAGYSVLGLCIVLLYLPLLVAGILLKGLLSGPLPTFADICARKSSHQVASVLEGLAYPPGVAKASYEVYSERATHVRLLLQGEATQEVDFEVLFVQDEACLNYRWDYKDCFVSSVETLRLQSYPPAQQKPPTEATRQWLKTALEEMLVQVWSS